MTNKDTLQRFLFENAPVRGEFVHLNESFQTIIDQHPYPPLIRQLLGETLAAASLLCAIIKWEGRLTIQFRGKGKLKLLLAQCNQKFHLRGLAQWEGEVTKAEVWDVLNQGVLAIMMDPDIPNGKRYQGLVAWQGSSIAESIEAYFAQSEQLPTRLWLAVDETSVAGLLLQIVPETSASYQNDWEHVIHLTQTLRPFELLTLDNKVLLHRLYSEEDVRLFEDIPVMFHCNCSHERSENAILLLGKDEIEDELKNKKTITVTCEFCNRVFEFDRVDLARIFSKGNKLPPETKVQ